MEEQSHGGGRGSRRPPNAGRQSRGEGANTCTERRRQRERAESPRRRRGRDQRQRQDAKKDGGEGESKRETKTAGRGPGQATGRRAGQRNGAKVAGPQQQGPQMKAETGTNGTRHARGPEERRRRTENSGCEGRLTQSGDIFWGREENGACQENGMQGAGLRTRARIGAAVRTGTKRQRNNARKQR